jgi:hypothetical protein
MTSGLAYDLLAELEAAGLSGMPGKLLYSGLGTLCPGKIYLLGWNPGGNPNAEIDSVRDDYLKLAQERSDWNEYLDGSWMSRARSAQMAMHRCKSAFAICLWALVCLFGPCVLPT